VGEIDARCFERDTTDCETLQQCASCFVYLGDFAEEDSDRFAGGQNLKAVVLGEADVFATEASIDCNDSFRDAFGFTEAEHCAHLQMSSEHADSQGEEWQMPVSAEIANVEV
jgi:hypothetical protein